MISLETSYRLDNRNYANGTKEGDEQRSPWTAAGPQPSPASAESAASSQSRRSISAVHEIHPGISGVSESAPARHGHATAFAVGSGEPSGEVARQLGDGQSRHEHPPQ